MSHYAGASPSKEFGLASTCAYKLQRNGGGSSVLLSSVASTCFFFLFFEGEIRFVTLYVDSRAPIASWYTRFSTTGIVIVRRNFAPDFFFALCYVCFVVYLYFWRARFRLGLPWFRQQQRLCACLNVQLTISWFTYCTSIVGRCVPLYLCSFSQLCKFPSSARLVRLF